MTRARRRRALIGSALTLALGALTGCMPDQAKDVAMYRDLIDLGAAPEAPADGAILTLREAAARLNDSSERLAIQGEDLVRAVAARRRAVSVFLPTVDLIPTLAFEDGTGSGGGISAGDGLIIGDSGTSSSWDVAVATRVTLFDGFRNVNRFKSAEADIENRRGLFLDLRESLLLDLVRTYDAILVAERSVGVLARSLELQEERLRDIRGKQVAGVARPLDVYQTEAQVAAIRVALVDARNSVERGRQLLSFLIAAPVGGAALDASQPVPSDLPPLEELIRGAIAARHDLAAAEAAARSARSAVDVAIGQYAPSVSLDLDWFLQRDSVPTDRDWAGLLAINVPIFTAGRIEADIQEAWAIFRQQVLAYQELRRTIIRDVTIALADFEASQSRLAEIEVQVRAAREAYRQADGSFQVGLATNLERLIALDQQLNAELAEAIEIFQRHGLYATLLRSTGRLSEHLTTVAVPLPPERPPSESPFVIRAGR